MQVLPPERLWQPAYDEPEDGSAPGYRAVAAFFGSLGMGLDLCRQAPASLRAIHRWLSLYKELRPLLHGGRTVRLDVDEPGFAAHGVVSARAGRGPVRAGLAGPVAGPGAAERAWTRRRPTGSRSPVLGPADPQAVTLGWPAGDAAPRLTGQALGTVGITLPAGRRGSALLLHLTTL